MSKALTQTFVCGKIKQEDRDMEVVRSKVKLLGYTMNINGEGPESVVAAAGKLCYSKVGIEELSEKMTEEDIVKFVKMLANLGHYSPFEHANFTFGIEGISRACSHQIVRHRTGKFSQQSQRYVDLESTFKIIMPPEIEACPEARNMYIKSIEEDFDAYKNITEALELKYINEGMDEKSANKKAIEDARFALPNACETKLVMTIDARNLINFFEKRCCKRAQWEIRNVANQMLDLVLPVAPNLFAKAGAKCVFGNCPEGKMSCGEKQKPRAGQ